MCEELINLLNYYSSKHWNAVLNLGYEHPLLVVSKDGGLVRVMAPVL